MLFIFMSVAVLANLAAGGTVLWDGRFDLSTDAKYKTPFSSKVYSAMQSWSFSKEVGPYEFYIPADNSAKNPMSDLVQLSPNFKNPVDKTSGQGVKLTLASKPTTNYQWRTELIPHTYDKNYSKSGMISKGLVFYHFSMMRKDENPPSTKQDHQMCYFENGHFVEMRYGLLAGSQATEGSNLHAFIDGKSRWNQTWLPNVWHNIAYEIDFGKNTVGFWHSEGNASLAQIVAPIKASTSSNGRDWHLGGLKLPATGTTPEDWYFSSVYIESSPITKELTGPRFV